MSKTNTAIQKSRENFKDSIYGKDDALFDRSGNNVSTQVEIHITTSQKDILSALIEDMEGLKKDNVIVPMGSGASGMGAMCKGCGGQEDCECATFNKGISKAQDIIRKAVEV